MVYSELGYSEAPANGDGIIRARTTKQIRCWIIPRSKAALDIVNNEFGKIEFPGNYILLEGKGKVYIGEAKSVCSRLKTHMTNPEDKIKKWDRAFIINDGRPATQSDFNDSVVRKSLELYLIKLFKTNKFKVVAQGEKQSLNAMQNHLVNSFRDEINFLLLKTNLITKLIDKIGQEQIYGKDLKSILEKNGKHVKNFKAHEAIINGERVFIRPGSQKTKGWQITFRDIFKDALNKGEGALLVPRGSILLLPMAEIQKVIGDDSEYEKPTIDIFVIFEEDKITLKYKQNNLDVTNFKLIP
jgi:predicted GIY-YIG superfamily endonuclease